MRLEDKIDILPLVGPAYSKKLKKLGITNIKSLINHFPARYLDFRNTTPMGSIRIGDTVTVSGKIESIKNHFTRTRKFMQVAEISDKTGKISAIWFNQTYLAKTLKDVENIIIAGKVDWFGRKVAIVSPEYEIGDKKKKGVHTGRLVPIYPETAGVSSKWLRSRIAHALPKVINKVHEFLPENILIEYGLMEMADAIVKSHYPKSTREAKKANKRVAFNELLFLHLISSKRKLDWQKNKATFVLDIKTGEVEKFTSSLPFTLTNSQKRSMQEILSDLKKPIAMNRLLEGDVGSGKTVVAAIACFVSFLNGHQSIIMAPTQILANQHLETLNTLFKKYKIRTSLITSSSTKKDPGKTDIFIGTHALIHKRVNFENVAFVAIDEQHRFGVEQRAHLVNTLNNQSFSPHVLTMTATPIPRTVVLTVYGDLSLSTLDEMPKGRQPITTWVVPPKKRNGAYEWIGKQIASSKSQAFVICPLIEESEKEIMSQVKAASVEYGKLKRVFPDLSIGLLHGRLKEKEKNKVLTSFKKGKINILVSTPVVEVGVDVPNATIMLVEGADRFGLAQLHQLRGRVGRGKKKSYCLLFTESKSESVNKRLHAMQKNISGFELAELDLKMRGPGEIFGTLQHGYHELRIASWQDTKLIKETAAVAEKAMKNTKQFNKLFSHLTKENIVMN